MKKFGRRFLLFVIALSISCASLGAAGVPLVQKAAAAGCDSPSIGFGRWRWCGYWYNRFEDSGDHVRAGGVPGSVNNATEFINLLKADMNSSNRNNNTGARFVILTMIGVPPPAPPQATGSAKTVTAAQVANWESRVRTYANISENGTTSTGTNGSIQWFYNWHAPCGIVNTYWQPTYNDIAPYTNNAANSTCENTSVREDFVIFRDRSGNQIYLIRRICMNPMGNIDPLANTPPPNFNLTPSISTTVNGATSNVAQVGDTVGFTYTVNNTGTTPSTSVACNTIASTYNQYHANGGAPPGGSPAGPNPGCPRVFPVGSTTVAGPENVPANTPNQTICRTLTVNPATFGGGSRTTNEICVIVASKPYMKVFGGDISAGSGLETAPSTCTSNTNAAVIAWNKRAAGGYAGAGVQYATYALRTITDFASAQGNAGGAPVPTGLSFANTTTNVGSGNFGGNFGSANCIPDYYDRKPTSTLGLPPNVSAMTTNAYGASPGAAGLTLTGGNVTSGEKVSVYINGNVYINSDITYAGAWDSLHIPLFELVVTGNIYISGSVTRLDGVYIAQRNGANTGTIYTCATGVALPTLTNGAFYNGCTNKLTVNGAFVANSVEFLRTGGTLSQSATNETSTVNGAGTSAGEVFNFNPSLWMVQPIDGSGRVDNYDAITSLPPVL